MILSYQPPVSAPLLAAAPEAGRLFQDIFPWVLALIGLAVLGAVVIWLVRRVTRSDSGGSAPGFTLQSLRDLRDQGELTEEEFQRARDAMIGRLAAPKQAEAPQPNEKADTTQSPTASRREGESETTPAAKPRRDDNQRPPEEPAS